MKGNQKDVSIQTNITYSLKTDTFNKPLKIVNHSDHIYVFKIKTNQRTVVSLQTTHDFILPGTTRDIAIKLADKPSESSQLKLEFNYAIPSEDDIRNKDSKMNSISKENIFKTVILVERNDDPQTLEANSPKKISESDYKKETPKKDYEKANHSTPIQLSEEKPRAQENSFVSGKGEEINITELVSLGDSETVEVEKSTKIDPFHESHKPAKKTEIAFKHVESQEIQISPKVEEAPVQKPQPSIENTFFSSAGNSTDFKPAESVFQSTVVKGKDEQEIVLAELEEKILREKQTIQKLQSSASLQSSYPLPVIFALIVASFVVGSLLGTLLA